MTFALNKILAPPDRILRQFAALWIVFFAAVAIAQQFYHHRYILALVFGILAATVGPIGLVWPRTIRPIFVGWMVVAFPIGWTISHAILGILFYLIFTPIALFFRMRGRDPLALKPRRNLTSYWTLRPKPKDKSEYLRQF